MSSDAQQARRIQAPISIGELIDKITILEIKAERIADPDKGKEVAKELALLRGIEREARLDTDEMASFADDLRAINTALWEIEDEIRECEARGDFGPRFVELARGVYRTNDRRSRVKARINAAFGSDIVEAKSYKQSDL
jgi:hypothetical protein